MSTNPTEAELESFRQQWREEVSARRKGKQPVPAVAAAATTTPSSSRTQVPKSAPPEPSHVRKRSEEIDEVQPHVYHELGEKKHGRRLDDRSAGAGDEGKEPKSAIEYYERAVERESMGSLGDSLNLYRKAFRMDERVHEKYKAKHFPPASSKPAAPNIPAASKPQDPNPSNAAVTVPNTAHHSLQGLPSSLQSLIDEFSQLSILGEPPPTELSPPPPCPIASIPEEILTEILMQLAIQDVASFVRLAQVCKRLTYLVMTEERVWKRIVLGHEVGFAAMHYAYACQINGKPLGDDDEGGYLLGSDSDSDSDLDVSRRPFPTPSPESLTASLIPTRYPTYRALFRLRPRIRFNGCYISTVNYTRPGASSPTSTSWGSPIHIVTYYRYLRFLRNGTCISLLTTSEPADVVPFLYPHHMHKAHGSLPSAPMKDALLGRWRLTGLETQSSTDVESSEMEGTLLIETAGPTPKYTYKMILGFGSAGRSGGVRNNKLAWQGYWSYNRLTDDWAEFGLKNDRPFYWSRVKSYGMGIDVDEAEV